jgi:hypothetical protein
MNNDFIVYSHQEYENEIYRNRVEVFNVSIPKALKLSFNQYASRITFEIVRIDEPMIDEFAFVRFQYQHFPVIDILLYEVEEEPLETALQIVREFGTELAYMLINRQEHGY